MVTKRRTLVIILVLCLPLFLYLVGTIVGLFWRTGISQFNTYVCCPKVISALRISLVSTLISTALAVLLGTPVAYLLAHCRFRGKEIIDTLVDLPLVLPPTAAGLALLLTFGRQGLGVYLERLNITLPLTFAAVVMAQLFVASPFFIKQARTGFEAVNPNLKLASMTLGASAFRTFIKVTVPMSKRALLAGTTMTWARALGEFGATVMFAGALPGVTETMPVAIYSGASENMAVAIVLAATLVAVSFIVLITARMLLGRNPVAVADM
jgi:molybdate transport system permease protein